MSVLDDVLAGAGAAPRGGLSAEPVRRLAVLTCMDTRLDPLRDLGLDIGDAHVIRNAGGRATDDALRSLLLSWHELETRAVLVVHHTKCGVRADDEETVRRRLEKATGTDLDGVDLHTFSDDEAAVREDVERIRGVAYAPDGLLVRGAIHDVEAGTIREV